MRRAILAGTAFLALAAVVALSGVVDEAPSLGEAAIPAGVARAQASVLMIDILPGGFNPPACTINRDARIPVKFVNRDTKPRRIVVDVSGIPEPGEFLYDTGVIPPGGTQLTEWRFNEVNEVVYHDHDNPALTGRIVVPISPNAGTDCEKEDGAPGADPCARTLPQFAGCRVLPGIARG